MFYPNWRSSRRKNRKIYKKTDVEKNVLINSLNAIFQYVLMFLLVYLFCLLFLNAKLVSRHQFPNIIYFKHRQYAWWCSLCSEKNSMSFRMPVISINSHFKSSLNYFCFKNVFPALTNRFHKTCEDVGLSFYSTNEMREFHLMVFPLHFQPNCTVYIEV